MFSLYRRPVSMAVPVLVLIALAGLAPSVAAQDQEVADDAELVAPRYGFGDSTLAMRLGIALPLFLLSTQAVETPPDGTPRRVLRPNLQAVAGTAAVNWNVYLDEAFTIGGELGGGLGVDINDALWYMVPILFRGAYVVSTPQMEIPIGAGIGAVVMRLVDNTRVAFAVTPGASFLWRATPDWSFGVAAEYWFIWEPPWAEASDPHFFGNFASVTATAVYHF